jgi:5-methylcytosine-specific restriction endonuclease McrA
MVRKYQDVTCGGCGCVYAKRADSLKLWNGLCRSCATKAVATRPQVRAKRSADAKEQIKSLGGKVPNCGKWCRSGDKTKHPRWKGGLPKCVDCGEQLASYLSTRCNECHYAWISGPNHPQWTGGLPDYPEEWNESLKRNVRRRDEYTCQQCGVHQRELNRKLDVHHKDENKFNCDLDNLVSLCGSCHMRLHKTKTLEVA